MREARRCVACDVYFSAWSIETWVAMCDDCRERLMRIENEIVMGWAKNAARKAEERMDKSIQEIRARVAAQQAKADENGRLAFSCVMGFEVPEDIWKGIQRELPNILGAAQ